MVHTVIEKSRSEKKDWGVIKVSIIAPPMPAAKANKIEERLDAVLDELQEMVTEQPPLPLGAPKPDKPVKGQRKLSLGKAGAVVETASDRKEPADFQPGELEPTQAELDAEDDGLRQKQAAADTSANPHRPVARPVAEPTGPLGR